jgi:RsiW-degrading membrane proteinase PrsW (M82 family)
MQLIGVVIGAFAPGIFWLWLVYRWDRYHPEPRWLVIRTFLWGMVAVIPIAFAELLLVLGGGGLEGLTQLGQATLSLQGIAYEAFIVAGVTEELGKFLVVRLSIYKSLYFDEATDGLIYSAAAALGFATLENIGYALSFGWGVMLLRGPISTFAHVLFSVVWGYPLGLRKVRYSRSRFYLGLGLPGAMAAHGLFDFLLFTQSWYAWLVIPLMGGLIAALVLMLRHSRRISPYREKVAEMQVNCPVCGAKAPAYANFCPACGASREKNRPGANNACGNCGAPLEKDAIYCTACGSRIVKKPWRRQ